MDTKTGRERRRFLARLAAGAVGAAGLGACEGGAPPSPEAVPAAELGPTPVQQSSVLRFDHGVASGDPLADRVLLWTRVSGAEAKVEVDWVVAEDRELTRPLRRGRVQTGAWRDFTIKVDVDGLEAARHYFFAFEAEGVRSAVGRTKTLASEGLEKVVLGVVSCSNFPAGFFNVYARLAEREDLDVVLHLGDYIYEFADGVYGDGKLIGRVPKPTHEIVSLADYRARHATYKGDVDSQALHAAHPMIAVWDDHEFSNDAWWGGAQNHDANEGAWEPRRHAAVQAYFEWMPVREVSVDERPVLYRKFAFGGLFDLFMLDTRLRGRDQAPPIGSAQELIDQPRQLMGATQQAWLFDGLSRSRAKWRVLGQQVMVAGLKTIGSIPHLTDNWDGYPSAREKLLGALERDEAARTVVLTGDIHSSWANELRRQPFTSTPGPVLAAEFATPAVSSPGLVRGQGAQAMLAGVLAAHPQVKWAELTRQGYLRLEIEASQVTCEWWHVPTVSKRNSEEMLAKRFRYLPGGELRESDLG